MKPDDIINASPPPDREPLSKRADGRVRKWVMIAPEDWERASRIGKRMFPRVKRSDVMAAAVRLGLDELTRRVRNERG